MRARLVILLCLPGVLAAQQASPTVDCATPIAAMDHAGSEYRGAVTEIPGGARVTITAHDTSDARVVARIRGLGFAGLMVEGDHHSAHHLALARGDAAPHGR